MDVGVFEPDANQLRVVARADPDRQPPAVDRLCPEIADAGAQKTDAVLVGVKAGERFRECFRDTVAAVGARHDPVIDRLAARIKADRVIRGRHDDALDPGAARRLEHVVEADDVAVEDVLPAVLARDAAEMDDAVDAGNHLLDCRHVGDVGLIDLLAPLVLWPRRRERHPVGHAQHRIDAAQRLAQRAADAAPCSGDQHALHHGSTSGAFAGPKLRRKWRVGQPICGFRDARGSWVKYKRFAAPGASLSSDKPPLAAATRIDSGLRFNFERWPFISRNIGV